MESLPNVTLIAYDNVDDPSRTLRALLYSTRFIKFAEIVLICRNVPNGANGTTIRRVAEEGRAAVTMWYINGVNDVRTDYALSIQHDGYVINPEAWRDDWLKYDFIGAPWPGLPHPIHPGKSDYPNGRVGNDGFCLRSRAFMQATAGMRDLFIEESRYPDKFGQQLGSDTFYCQRQRPALERLGLKFAPIEVAAAFAWESNIEEVPGDRPYAFGFHKFHLENKQVHRV